MIDSRAVHGTGLQIVRSNRTEALLDVLSERLLADVRALGNPLAKTLVVVQGRGMAVWLNMELSRRHEVWANADYVYPRNLIARAFRSVLPDVDEAKAYSWERLFWSVMNELPGCLEQAEFAPLRHYLDDDTDGSKQLQLCEKIADSFDEYLTYRPELLAAWERKRGRGKSKPASAPQLSLFASATADSSEGWQERLWHLVRARFGDDHPAIREHQFRAALEEQKNLAKLPARISVFGLSSLPPLFLRILSGLATRTRVELYLTTASERRGSTPLKEPGLSSNQRDANATDATPRNRLLSSYALQSLEFEASLEETAVAAGVRIDRADRFGTSETTLLGRLQRDLRLDRETPPESPPTSVDASVRFHACHSPTREVEVLHDQLLDWIQRRGLRPHEIAVMAPNIDEYAPLIQAVFDRGPGDARFIPYRISDRRLQGDSEVFDALARVFDLVRSRVSSTEVLDLLTQACVRDHFGIAASDLETIRRWVTESGARFGIDAEHRASFQLPKEHANTWSFALERLLVGYAVSTRGNDLALGVLPYDEIEGKAGELLGRFTHFLRTLFRALQRLAEARTLEAWQRALAETSMDLFVQEGEASWQHEALLAAISELFEASRRAGFHGELSGAVVERLLGRTLDAQRSARGFLSGGVTFCAMTPMRSIPFRAVWLLGMNDGAFPRTSHRPDFHLMEQSAEGRRPGDPNRRLDDRHLFLECLLAARDRFVVSYVGQSIRDNAELPPAVVVSELRDYLVEVTLGGAPPEVRRALSIRHPLQPFSPRYYAPGSGEDTAELFSYETGYLQGAKLLSGERRPAAPLFDALLEPIETRDASLAELIEFFSSPINTLLRRRLGIDLREQEVDVPNREPSILDGLDLYRVGSTALEHQLFGIDEQRSFELLRARGELPAGAAGSFEFQRALASARPIAERARSLRSVLTHERVAVDVRLNGGGVTGELSEVWARGLVQVQFARVSAKHVLQSWIRHLALCLVAPSGVAANSWLIGRPEDGDGVQAYRFEPVSDPRAELSKLLELRALGSRKPLLFFPEASRAFAEGLVRYEGDAERSLYKARSAFAVELERGLALQRVFGADTTLGPDGPEGVDAAERPGFRELAEQVFFPLLQHLTEPE